MKKMVSVLLCTILSVSAACPIQAADKQKEEESAALYLRERGIMVGDDSGNMNLNQDLNRAELAVLLTRLNGGMEKVQRNLSRYAQSCTFSDVPTWARPYVSYCAENQLMAGYGNGIFGPNDQVTPAMACTVVLRVFDVENRDGSVWSYSTAYSYAVKLGWMDEDSAHSAVITRGEMAVLIYRALTGARPGDVYQTTGNGYLTNGKPVTEQNVLELLCQLKKKWPTGTLWSDPELDPGTYKNTVPSTESGKLMRNYRTNGTYGCGGYASMISSCIFGDTTNPCHRVEDLAQIRPGDIIFRVSNTTGKIWHVTVALESPNDLHGYHVTDGNHGGIVYWPDEESEYSRENLDCYGEDKSHHLEVWTRYPEDVPYTGNSVGVWSTGKEKSCT